MDVYFILAKAHGGFAMLLALLALLSLVTALVAVLTKKVLALATPLGLIETISAGLVTLSGLALLVLGPYPLTQIWLWLGLAIAVIYNIVLKRWVKPARLAAMANAGAGKWALGQFVLVALVVAAFGLMKLKAF